jgi:hypothetical protein
MIHGKDISKECQTQAKGPASPILREEEYEGLT